jgi:hypothetical protein
MNDDTQAGADALEAAETADDTDLGDGRKTKGWSDPEPEP